MAGRFVQESFLKTKGYLLNMKKREGILAFIFIFLVLVILRFVGPFQPFFNWTHNTTRTANAVLIVSFAFILARMSHVFIKDLTVRKLAHYVVFIGAAVTIFFAYQDKLIAVGISLGILAVAFTFIFQSPLLSLVGWIYLTIGKVYSEGDRIRLNNFKGDVVSINPMRTKIKEVSGEYLANDTPSGRLVTFPNSMLLTEPVFNYTKYFPYIWVDLPFHLTYETDFDFVRKVIEKIVQKHLKPIKGDMRKKYESMLKKLEIADTGFKALYFNMVPYQSWIEFRVSVPVLPKKQAIVLSDILEEILKEFNKHPNKVKFPKGRAR